MGSGRRVLVLLVLTFIYLFIGASVFSVIESAHEQKIKLDLFNHLETFVEHNPCVNISEFRDVLTEVWYAASIGVEKMTGRENDTAPSSSRWNLANAFFFSTTVITTIGYGHLSPVTSAGQNVCIAYACFGIPLMAVLLSEISSKWKQRLMNVGLHLNTRLVNVLKRSRVRKVAITIILLVPTYVIVVIIPAVVFSYIEGWDFLVAHYYCFISLSTIGLGDFVATQHDYENKALVWVYKIGTSLYLIAGLGIMAIVFHGVQTKTRKRSSSSFSQRFVNILRKRKKPWLNMMEEQAEMMVEGFPVDAGIISSTVTAAAVVVCKDNGKQNGDNPHEDDHLDSCRSSSDNEDSDDDLHEVESLDNRRQSHHYLQNREKSNSKNSCNFRKSDDYLDPADEEEETSFVFRNVIVDRHASVCIDPDSDGTEEENESKNPTNDLDHPKLTRKSSLPHRLDLHNFGARKKITDLTPEANNPLSQTVTQRNHFSDSKTELRGAIPKNKLWSPSNSLAGEDSGIHAASSQSTIEMESTV